MGTVILKCLSSAFIMVTSLPNLSKTVPTILLGKRMVTDSTLPFFLLFTADLTSSGASFPLSLCHAMSPTIVIWISFLCILSLKIPIGNMVRKQTNNPAKSWVLRNRFQSGAGSFLLCRACPSSLTTGLNCVIMKPAIPTVDPGGYHDAAQSAGEGAQAPQAQTRVHA